MAAIHDTVVETEQKGVPGAKAARRGVARVPELEAVELVF